MAKIGTAHVEVKPVLNQEALDRVCKEIEDQVAAAVLRGASRRPVNVRYVMSDEDARDLAQRIVSAGEAGRAAARRAR